MVDIPSGSKSYIEYIRNSKFESNTLQVSNREVPGIGQMYGETDFVIDIDEKMSRQDNLLELFKSKIQGINYAQNNRNANISIKGEAAPPLILLDGIPLNEYIIGFEKVNYANLESVSSNAVMDFLSEIDVKSVQRIDIIKSRPDLINSYGIQASNGLIAIYSKQGQNSILSLNNDKIAQMWLPGYIVPEEFPAPNYSSNIVKDRGSDRRTTIYWNPDVKTNRRGRAKIGFYNSDDARNLQICVEGISDEGVPIFSIYEIGRNSGKGKVN